MMFRHHTRQAAPRAGQEQTGYTSPRPRTLRLDSPMTRSNADLKKLAQFDFGFNARQQSPEPLFVDTFYMSSEDEPSPLTPPPSEAIMGFIERLNQPRAVQQEEIPDTHDDSDMELEAFPIATYMATQIAYYNAGKPKEIHLMSRRSHDKSRGSSISSTRDTIYTGPTDSNSGRSTPASSISEYQSIAPSSPSRYSYEAIPEPSYLIVPKSRGAPTSLMVSDESSPQNIDASPLSPFAKRSAPRSKPSSLGLSTSPAIPASPVVATTAKTDLKKKRSAWSREWKGVVHGA